MPDIFSQILSVDLPQGLRCEATTGKNPPFEIVFVTDGTIPFPQIIIWDEGRETIIRDKNIRREDDFTYAASIPAGRFSPGEYVVQVEGCKRADLAHACAEDWVKHYFHLWLDQPAFAEKKTESAPAITPPAKAPQVEVAAPRASDGRPKMYFGIHKHMHQPYYDTTNSSAWDGQKDEIFGSRCGPYTHFVPTAVRQYQSLPHAGLSASWSGSLIEQLERCGREGLCGGCFSGWNNSLREAAQLKTACGNPRLAFSAFGFFHPLMPLVPSRDIVKQIEWHRGIIQSAFGAAASRVLFPPETAFHVRIIPALVEAGIEAVIYDSIHRYRSCKDYPYAGVQEGMLPPNQAEQENPAVSDWHQLNNVWAGSKISPGLLRPEYIKYEDPDGKIHKIIGVPAERYLGNEDARGGFGALQYPDVLGQVYDKLLSTGGFDPAHPPFFLLHSDGDNYGGGADSYYGSNTGQLVQWLQQDSRFELISVQDYLQMFPPDPANAVHVEPGSWSGADNGDPQFRKWFSRYEESYSPDLNSWAVLTALQNAVHSLEDTGRGGEALGEATRLLLMAETSCYWYWTGQDIWDAQVTNAANKALSLCGGEVDSLVSSGQDRTGPTIFPPWVTPENPGGKTWGNNCLRDAPREATLHTFIHDISGVKQASLILRTEQGEQRLPLKNNGAYPGKTGARATANYYTAELPVGAGLVKYYIEAEDDRGNVSRSALERIFLG
jgi:hypothetical protein